MHKRLIGILGTVAIVAAACGGATPSTAPSAGASAGASASAGAAGDQTLTYPVDADISGGLTNASDNVPAANANAWLYNQLYTYDATLKPAPDLAAELATISPDGLTWTVTLKQGVKFHDGSEMTADDVVQTYELARSENCTYQPDNCNGQTVAKVEKIDDYTVAITTKEPNATVATSIFPALVITNKDVIDASYARYSEATKALTAAEITAFLAKVDAEVKTPTGPPAEGDTAPTVNFAQFAAEAEALLGKAGQPLADKTLYALEDGSTDESEAGYTADNIARIRTIQTTQTAGAIDALAAAYKFLDIQLKPVGLGTGPFKFVEYKTGELLTYESNPDYFAGASTISKMFLPIIKDDIAGAQALAAGQVDWKYSIEGGSYDQIKDDPNLKFAIYPDFGFFSLYFNQREGSLFADKNLRQAVSYCFDKEATATAATTGYGVAIYSEIPPASWAYPTEGLNTYPMDTAKSKALIESSGWTMGSDGIYEKDGKKLATVVPVRAGRANRSKWLQLMADQVKECGIDFTYKEVDFGGILGMINAYPHINAAEPEKGKPFDAYFGGFSTGFDPDPYSLYHGASCATKDDPNTFNYICYQNPEVDALIEKGLVEFDQDQRAKIYGEYAIIQSNDLPVIYAWSDIAHQGLRNTVNTTDPAGFILDSIQFAWQGSKVTNIK